MNVGEQMTVLGMNLLSFQSNTHIMNTKLQIQSLLDYWEKANSDND